MIEVIQFLGLAAITTVVFYPMYLGFKEDLSRIKKKKAKREQK